ncbi:hypothetical protein P171DRAFT_426024 [Karstenula rhodostoma CBS 690.94]|uniref:Rhodopsin domain-containing protein n=1 Tax=Karstenula rhodostoma CBS 690.94 TaxID=1392251 RepID=A0A9P4PZ34_9PLEO|nr:hypothetical protein P171DRAFT_426024 [Karstenula rhodostoma CBS 690.94]
MPNRVLLRSPRRKRAFPKFVLRFLKRGLVLECVLVVSAVLSRVKAVSAASLLLSSFCPTMDSFAAIFENPPDPSDPVPIYNKPSIIYGATLPFHILAWFAVALRVYTRLRIVRAPGWDDSLIIISVLFNLVSLITFYGGFHHGLGKHLYYIDPNELVTLSKFLYVQNAAYYTCAGFIKLSLLCQYLRLFQKGIVRQICIVLLVLTGLWTFFWLFQGWFPCFPVSGSWDRGQIPPAKCWGLRSDNIQNSLATFVAFAATNMVLDTTIFFMPMTLYFKPTTTGPRQVLALLMLFMLGSVVLLMSVLRLWATIRHNRNDVNSLDFTWWYPLTMILASLEIDFAIICASIPIFWPLIVNALPQIFVTKEVRVTHHQRLPDNTNTDYEMERTYSVKSSGGDSQENLRDLHEHPKTDYSDPFVVDHVTGQLENNAQVVSEKLQKRRQK